MTTDQPPRIIVTGCRSWRCNNLARDLCWQIRTRFPGVVVVHGGAEGVDSAFERAAKNYQMKTEIHPARWGDIDYPDARVCYHSDGSPYDANAGPRRNQEMVDLGAIRAIAVHRSLPNSLGTKDCVRRLMTANIPVWLFDKADSKGRLLLKAP